MVRALLGGTKTQTRRIMKTQLVYGDVCGLFSAWYLPKGKDGGTLWPNGKEDILATCPYGQPGDHLWVGEEFAAILPQDPKYNGGAPIAYDYAATYQHGDRLGDRIGVEKTWTPAKKMQRAASRMLLEIVSVRVELLNDCSAADATAAGVAPDQVRQFSVFGANADERAAVYELAAIAPYKRLWESINGDGSWASNPWVWVIEFKRVPLHQHE